MSLIFRDNIRQIISELGVSISEFAEIIGEKASRLNDVLQGRQRPPFDLIEKIISSLDVDANWLISGQGVAGVNHGKKWNISDEFEYIPMYDVEVSAGRGIDAYGAAAPKTYLAFRKDWLRARGLFADSLNCVTARGDSMEPTISNKDTLLVNTARSNPVDGRIYVIRSEETLWVKRVQRQLDGSLLLISDNESYPPMHLDLRNHENIEIIGQVVNVSSDII